MGEGSKDFCYWDARSTQDFIVLVVVQIITCGVIVINVMRLVELSKNHTMGRGTSRMKKILGIHGLVLCWALSKICLM